MQVEPLHRGQRAQGDARLRLHGALDLVEIADVDVVVEGVDGVRLGRLHQGDRVVAGRGLGKGQDAQRLHRVVDVSRRSAQEPLHLAGIQQAVFQQGEQGGRVARRRRGLGGAPGSGTEHG